jgi:hypothetical protein
VLLSSGDSFPHLIQKPRSQLGFVTYLLNRPRTSYSSCMMWHVFSSWARIWWTRWFFGVYTSISNFYRSIMYSNLISCFKYGYTYLKTRFDWLWANVCTSNASICSSSDISRIDFSHSHKCEHCSHIWDRGSIPLKLLINFSPENTLSYGTPYATLLFFVYPSWFWTVKLIKCSKDIFWHHYLSLYAVHRCEKFVPFCRMYRWNFRCRMWRPSITPSFYVLLLYKFLKKQ